MEAIKNLNEKVAGIIETITNANGTAIKFADGTMICRGGFSVPANTSEKEVNLPASFIDVNFTVIVTNKYAFTNNTLFSINIIKKEAFNKKHFFFVQYILLYNLLFNIFSYIFRT